MGLAEPWTLVEGSLLNKTSITSPIALKTTLSLRPNPLADLKGYLSHYPNECEALSPFMSLLEQKGPGLLSRGHCAGHIVASGLVLDQKAQKVLVVHHRVLGLWLAPGGHYEGAGTLRAAAAREVQEETGYAGARPFKHPLTGSYLLDIDAHEVPGNPSKGEGPHWHYDYLFLFAGDSAAELIPQEEEVLGARWLSLTDYSLTSARAQRICEKLEALVSGIQNEQGRGSPEEAHTPVDMPDDVNAFFDALSDAAGSLDEAPDECLFVSPRDLQGLLKK